MGRCGCLAIERRRREANGMKRKWMRLLTLVLFGLVTAIWLLKGAVDFCFGISGIQLVLDLLCAAIWCVGFAVPLRRYRRSGEE